MLVGLDRHRGTGRDDDFDQGGHLALDRPGIGTSESELELGATFAVSASDPECVAKVRAATGGGVHFAFEMAGAAKAMEIAEKIAANGPLAVKAIRKSVRACLGKPEHEALRIESELSGPVFQTEDAREGPRAFMEKRKPQFRGR